MDVRSGVTRWPMVDEVDGCGQHEPLAGPASESRGDSRGAVRMVCTDDGGAEWVPLEVFLRHLRSGEIVERREGGTRRFYWTGTECGVTSRLDRPSWSGRP